MDLFLKTKGLTHFFKVIWYAKSRNFSFFLMFSYTFMTQANEIICIFIIGLNFLFGTMVGSPGYMAAEI